MEAMAKGTAAAGGGGRRRSTAISSGSGTTTGTTLERKEIERKRRQHMNGLCFKLASLIPKERKPKDTMSQMGSLDEAAAYIKDLKQTVDDLQRRRSSAQLMAATRGGAAAAGAGGVSATSLTTSSGGTGSELEAAEPPVVEARYHDEGSSSSLDVALICSVERPFRLHEVITVLEEEGAEVLSANLSVAGHKVFYTIHARAFSSRIGIEVSRVSERLRELV